MTPAQAYLAFDVSTPFGSVAVARGGEVLARGFLTHAGEHAAQLIPAIASTLDEAGVGREALEGIVVGRGPGSFTGVRVAGATARGLAMGLGVPLWPRSSLAAAAVSDGAVLPDALIDGAWDLAPSGRSTLSAGDRPRYILFDARGDRVYAACYELHAGAVEVLVDPHASTIEDVLRGDLPTGVCFAGSGALRHEERIGQAGYRVLDPPVGIPTAEGLLRLHALYWTDAPEPPGSRWEPEYLRGSWSRRPIPLPDR